MVAATKKYRAGLRRHPVTVLVDADKREYYSRPVATAGGKVRPRFDLTGFLCDWVEVNALSEHDAQGLFREAFGIGNTTAEFVVSEVGETTGERGVIHAGPPLGAKAREESVAQPSRKRLRSMATIGKGSDGAQQSEAEAEQDQPRKRRGGLRSE